MKTITELKNREWFSDKYKNHGRILRLFLYLIVFNWACLTFSSCVAGYVATEPEYDEVYVRPASPGFGYIWIDGDWIWNYRTHVYEHEHGYWTKPREGRSYEAGHWESEPRGRYWIKGQWNREDQHSSYAHDHDHDKDHDRR